ncbi:MAG: ABC transporter ATP-binding protein [Deltaproteobacteria bacterium]|nr:ABC transporter ATP-binding protein [Deltaproteobacteria bacterium]
MKNANPIIRFKNISISFGNLNVLNGMDLTIYEGETITIIGGSGSGKSVALKLLLGVLKPDSGFVYFQGRDVTTMDEKELIQMRKQFGMLFQGGALFDSLSVKENIAYPLREHFDYTENELDRIVTKKLSLIGLPGVEQRMPADLSGGMKKRVGLARAIAADPKVILYDEPTTGLDPANTQRINRLIIQMQEKLKVTSIVVTHDMESAFTVSDRLALLKDGKICFVGTKEETKKSTDPTVRGFIEGKMTEKDHEEQMAGGL